MGLPIYRKIVLTPGNLEHVIDQVEELGMGKSPAFIVIDTDDNETEANTISQLSTIFNQKEISSYFPFPTYILTKIDQSYPNLLFCSEESELPSHFKRSTRRLTNKESNLIKKINIKVKKIKQMEINQKMELLNHKSTFIKKLSRLSQVQNYYSNVYRQLKNAWRS